MRGEELCPCSRLPVRHFVLVLQPCTILVVGVRLGYRVVRLPALVLPRWLAVRLQRLGLFIEFSRLLLHLRPPRLLPRSGLGPSTHVVRLLALQHLLSQMALLSCNICEKPVRIADVKSRIYAIRCYYGSWLRIVLELFPSFPNPVLFELISIHQMSALSPSTGGDAMLQQEERARKKEGT